MDIQHQYQNLLPKLKKTLAHITEVLEQEFQEGFVVETHLKSLESTQRKCKDKDCHQITDFSDLIRGRLFFPRPFTYHQVLQRLISLFQDRIKKIEWKKNYDHGLSYHGILHIDIQINHLTFELQVMPTVFKPFVEPQHKIYELLRDEPKMPEKKRQQLREMHNRIFDFLEDQIQDLI